MAFMDFTRTALKICFPSLPPGSTRRCPGNTRHAAAAMWKLIWKPAFSAACAAASAPPAAITVDRAAGTWSIDRMGCVQCADCTTGCPKHCLQMQPGYTRRGRKSWWMCTKSPSRSRKKKRQPQGGKIVNDMEKCILCGLCARKCPQSAIAVDRKESHTWVIDRSACVQCGACMDACLKFHALSFAPDDGAAGTETYTKPV